MSAALHGHISAMCEMARKVKAGNLLHNRIRVNECSRLAVEQNRTPLDGTSPGTEDYFTPIRLYCCLLHVSYCK